MVWLMAATAVGLLVVTVTVYRRFWNGADATWGACRDCTERTEMSPSTPAQRQERRDAARTASREAARAYVEQLQNKKPES